VVNNDESILFEPNRTLDIKMVHPDPNRSASFWSLQ
jgi:hypothetical protein